MDSVNRPTGQHHGDLRNALVSAAEGLIASRGLSGWGMADTSRVAGVSVAAPYKHFAGREELIAAVAAGGLRALSGELSSIISPETEPVDNLASFASHYVGFASRHHAKFAAAFLVERDKARFPDLVEASQQIFALLTPSAESLVGPKDAAELVMSVGALAHGFALLDLPVDGAEGAARAVRVLTSGALVQGRRPGRPLNCSRRTADPSSYLT